MDRLKGKRALISGGSSGIGLETARQFAAEGAKVAITASHPGAFQAARQEFGDALLYIASDAADASDQRTVAETMKEHFGSLDILFVNAGVAELKPLDAWDEAAYGRSFRTNVRGPFFLIQALLPVFGNPASIILNASINAHTGMPNTSVYGATKAALLSLARTLSGELRVAAKPDTRAALRQTWRNRKRGLVSGFGRIRIYGRERVDCGWWSGALAEGDR
jgi:NAD(P)-dependent dehydrogenase (short-subunit alcohol dehydrogenase family)